MNSVAVTRRAPYPWFAKERHLDNTHALESFLAQVERRAYRMAHIATANREEALDIVQDAMMLLVQRYAGRNADDWGPLFQRILQNRIRDWYRRQKVRARWRAWLSWGEGEGATLEDLPDPRNAEPSRDHANHELAEDLDAALRALPLRQQQVFLLRAWEGLDVADTARTLGISGGSVKTHYSRALQRLRELLGEHWP